MLGFITDKGDRLIAVVIFSLGASLPILVDERGNMIVTEKGRPLLVEDE